MVPADYSPTVDALCADLPPAVCHLHEVVTLARGTARSYLARVEDEWLEPATASGLRLTAALRTALVSDSEVITIWSVPDWDRWAEVERFLDDDPVAHRWRERTADIVVSGQRTLLCAAPLSPLRTGRQP